MPNFKNRTGSQIVEAAMVLPLTIVIIASLIILIMGHHFQLLRQIEEHGEARNQMYHFQETARIRMMDTLTS